VEWAPVFCEGGRLRILGSYFRRKHTVYETFPDCCIDAINWSKFPAHALEQCFMGDASHFDKLLGQPILVSEKMKQVMVKSLVSHC